jgi:hypothetical protein
LFNTFDRNSECYVSLPAKGQCQHDIEDHHGHSESKSFPTSTVVLGSGNLRTHLLAALDEKSIRIASRSHSAILVAAVHLLLRRWRQQLNDYAAKSEWHAGWDLPAYGQGDLGVADSIPPTYVGSAVEG